MIADVCLKLEGKLTEVSSHFDGHIMSVRPGAAENAQESSSHYTGLQHIREDVSKVELSADQHAVRSAAASGQYARGLYANWARPTEALMRTAFSFQSELMDTYEASVQSGVTTQQLFYVHAFLSS